MEDELNRGLPSDRFEAEWWLTRSKPPSAADPVVVLGIGRDGGPEPRLGELRSDRPALIEIPSDLQAIKRTSMELALRWRLESRAAFETALAAGLVAVDFERTGAYVMDRLP